MLFSKKYKGRPVFIEAQASEGCKSSKNEPFDDLLQQIDLLKSKVIKLSKEQDSEKSRCLSSISLSTKGIN